MNKISYHIEINPAYASSARVCKFLERLPEDYSSLGECVYNKRNSVRLMTMPSACGDGEMDVAVKSYKRLGLAKAIIYTLFKPSKARRAYFNALEVIRRGFDTPQPIAFIEEKEYGLIRDSYFVSMCRDMPSIYDNLYKEENFNPAMAEKFGSFVAALHEAGILHHDLNCDNVLYSRRPDGEIDFMLIDINRMTLLPEGCKPSMKQRILNLCRFTRSPRITGQVAAHYAKRSGLDPDSFAATATKAKSTYNKRRTLKKLLLHPLK